MIAPNGKLQKYMQDFSFRVTFWIRYRMNAISEGHLEIMVMPSNLQVQPNRPKLSFYTL